MRRFSGPEIPRRFVFPKEFRFDVEEVEVSREGDAIILRPHVNAQSPWESLRAALAGGVSEDFMAGGREQPQDRPGVDELFR
jgi:antitoxin VapB